MTEQGVLVVTLISVFREAHIKVLQPWYTKNVGEDKKIQHILAHLENIMVWGSPSGYFPDPTKNILVIFDPNLAW